MVRNTFRSALASIAVVSMFAIAMPAGVTHATRPQAAPVGGDHVGANCLVLRVQLNGDQPVVATCLQATPVSGHSGTAPGPNISTRACATTDVHLYLDAGYAGPVICFYGYGTTNLTDYWLDLLTSWNDQASSFTPGNWSGKFYWNTNGSGSYWLFAAGLGGGNLTGVWNDQVSSLCIGVSPNNCP